VGDAELILVKHAERLELREAGASQRRQGLFVAFAAPSRGSLSKHQPLAKAIGRKARTVLDATAGLGGDAFLLACMGYHVTAIERSPVIHALFEDGLRRARADPAICRALGDRLILIHADARESLGTLEGMPDVVYLDPMFPPKRKTSALAKKEIRMVRSVVGDDEDATGLFAAAMKAAAQRVVVKRPHHAPPLSGKPTVIFAGKLVRYDVYRVGA
jgi:16S rRNA (guanine1516-N2)-methyltransferase